MSLSAVQFEPMSQIDPGAISQGNLHRLFLRRGGIRPTSGSQRQGHQLSPAGLARSQQRRVNYFALGNGAGLSTVSAVAQVETLTISFAEITAGTTNLIVRGPLATKTYPYVSGAPGADEIQKQTDSDTTATNTAAAIEADKAALGIAGAAAVGNVVTVTGDASGAAFTLDSNESWLFDFQITQVGISAAVAAAGSISLKLSKQALVVGTQTVLGIDGFVYPALSTNRYKIRFVDTVQEGDTERTIFDRLRKSMIHAATGNYNPESNKTFVGHAIPDFDEDTFAVALQAYFGATPATKIVATGAGVSARLNLTAGDAGVWANFVQMYGETRGSVPQGLPTINAAGAPNGLGWEGPGLFRELKVQATTTTAENNYANIFYRGSQPVTGGAVNCSLVLGQNFDPEVQNLIGGSAVLTGSEFLSMMQYGALGAPESLGLMSVMTDPNNPQRYKGFILYDVRNVSGYEGSADRAASPDYTINLSAQPDEVRSPGGPFGGYYVIDAAA